MLKRVEIFDMDGTLVNSEHRYRINPETGKIDLPYWKEHDTAEFISKDTLLPLANYYKKCLLDPTIYVVIATARVLKQADYDYIEKHLGMPDKIIGRPLGSMEKGAILKSKGLAFLRSLKQFRDLPGYFHEDNPDYLVAICRTFGYTGRFYPSEQVLHRQTPAKVALPFSPAYLD